MMVRLGIQTKDVVLKDENGEDITFTVRPLAAIEYSKVLFDTSARLKEYEDKGLNAEEIKAIMPATMVAIIVDDYLPRCSISPKIYPTGTEGQVYTPLSFSTDELNMLVEAIISDVVSGVAEKVKEQAESDAAFPD